MDYPVKTIRQLQPILKAFRKVRGLTQGELAQELGVSQQALSSLESKPHRASFERLLAYLFALDVEIVLRERKSGTQSISGEW
jgi:HTH-type transcriptional regulator/antitoxin HipB